MTSTTIGQAGFFTRFRDSLLSRKNQTKNSGYIDCSSALPRIGKFTPLLDSQQPINAIRSKICLPMKIFFFVSDEQKEGIHLNGIKLGQKIYAEYVFPAHVGFFLTRRENRHLIPRELKNMTTLFWTLYTDDHGGQHVPAFIWDESEGKLEYQLIPIVHDVGQDYQVALAKAYYPAQ